MHKIRYLIVTFFCFIFIGWAPPPNRNFSLVSCNNTQVKIIDFTGFIGRYPISMRLHIKEKTNGNINYTGFYYYNKVGTKINLSGSWEMRPGTPTYIELNEMTNGKYTGSFSLLPQTYDDYSTLTGNWSGNGKTLKVKLTKLN